VATLTVGAGGLARMLHDVFPGSSEMARRMRALDWSKTPLGAVEHWPQPLRTSVSTCLDCAFPIVLWWGRELNILYNDEYCELLGPSKHPAALGRPGAEVWAEIWDVIEPMLLQVMNSGEPTRSRDLLLHVDRGYPEEAYFSFSYSPIHGERGGVSGVFCPVIETTGKVIGERRLRTLRDLAARCKGLATEEAASRAAAAVIASNPHDVPFALLYHVDGERTEARLQAAIGIGRDTDASPEHVPLAPGAPDRWQIRRVLDADEPLIVAGLPDLFEALPSGAWQTPPQSAVVLPVRSSSQDRPDVVLVAAVSPMRALDEDYRTFFGLVATQLAAGLADAHALEQERRRAERLAALDRAKTAFFSNVSHEFRTPLTLILAPLEDLRASASVLESPDTAAALDIVHRNSLRLLKLVNTLLDFSRIEAGRVDASYEPVDLATFTTDLASVFRSAVERAGLALTIACDPLPDPVFVDRDMWEKIVLNLLSNALKFTFEGEITVTLRPAGTQVELRVVDTGVGIPAEDLPRMFQRFHRVKHARARTHEGTGIGLALVQELARQHGGTVSVASREGHGTAFTVRIPTGDAHLPPERIVAARQLASTGMGAQPYVEEALRWLPHDASPSSHAEVPPDLPAAEMDAVAASRPRVLIADDNADMRDYIVRLLGQRYRVDAVGDGRAALERVQTDPPDLVLSDVMMPGLDGFGLLAAIRGDERSRSIPVMLLSARAGQEARIEGLRAGADDYVVKPFTARELLARIDSQLELALLRRDAEQALRHRSEQFETLFRQAPIGIYLVDADFRIREVNPVALPVFGDIPGGVIGRDIEDVIHILWAPDYADEVVRIFRSTLDTGRSYVAPERAEFRVDRGIYEYYEWRLDRLTLPDGRYGLVCYFRDISAQVRARLTIAESERQLREADSRKDEFLALLAHELRNPLAPIRTGLELLRLSGDSPDTVGRVRSMMERQVTQMVRLIDDLLDVSRITSGKIVLQRRPTPLADLVQAAIEGQRAAIEAGGIALHMQLPSEPCVVDVDPARLVQILSNVLHNASKFTPPGGRIRVGADVLTLAPPSGREVAITVSDTGIGIPDDVLPRIFDLFTQGDTPADRSQSGLGIGLALAKRLIEMHGGRITAHSDGPGQGSRFVMHLPLSTTAPAVPPPLTETPRVRSRVLIVDDNRDAAVALSLFVQELGGSAMTAHDGTSGLAAVEEFKPDIVFLDIGMPGLDGYEVCRRIRQMPSQRQVMIVAVTGWGQSQDKRRAFEAGFDTHLTKPVDPDTLAQLLAGATI
jgi:PAS domain S-box-containing protein